MLLSHPGYCLGYRVEYKGRSVCYITDNELYLGSSPNHNPHYENKLAEFVKHTDLLITDTTYTDEEYQGKVGWGHSCISKVTELAHRAEVKSLRDYHLETRNLNAYIQGIGGSDDIFLPVSAPVSRR